MGILKDFTTDLDRYMVDTGDSMMRVLLLKQGLWLTGQYRLSHWVKYKFQFPIIRPVLRLLCAISKKVLETVTNNEFPNSAEIGAGCFIPHPYGIVLHSQAKIGRYCNLGQQVTIGWSGQGENSGVPILGDRVFVGPGAKVLGKIKIGNNVVIGANAVVTKDLPDNSVAVGVPAKVINTKGSQHLIKYPANPD